MAEETEVERTEHFYERQLAKLEVAQEVRMKECLQRHEEVVALHVEKEKELLAQNDALLGAIGRLQRENEDLRKKIQEANLRFDDFRTEVLDNKITMEREIERLKKGRKS